MAKKKAGAKKKPGKTRKPAAKKVAKTYGPRKDLGAPIEVALKKLSPPVREIVEKIRGIVRATVPDVEEGLKWGMPVWSKGRPLCYAAPATGHVRFGFYGRGIIADAGDLEIGGERMPHVKIEDAKQVKPALFAEWLRRAAAAKE